ncbi:MAG: hypothetical protein LBL18_02865, partial [Bacteroidales bacterium]|nr:hypothetical protein [Bacteroidales bacterium]
MTEKKKQNGLKGTRICLEGESRRRSFKMLSSLKVSTAILAVVIAVVFYACNKETIQDNLLSPKKAEIKSELQELYDQMPHVDYGNIKVVHDDILQFESEEHYEKVIKQLTQRYEEWSTMFLDKYDVKVTEDELDSIQDALGFSDYMPMIKFEEEFGIYGKNLRYMQRNIEDDWLDKGAVGLPLTDKMIIDPAEQTLLNKYREVCIGDIIHQVREDCSVLIPLKYASALSNIRSMSTEALTKDGRVKVLKIAGGCYEPEWYKSKYQEHPVNSKKFKWEYSFHYSSIISCYRSIEKMTNYTKNKKGKWR